MRVAGPKKPGGGYPCGRSVFPFSLCWQEGYDACFLPQKASSIFCGGSRPLECIGNAKAQVFPREAFNKLARILLRLGLADHRPFEWSLWENRQILSGPSFFRVQDRALKGGRGAGEGRGLIHEAGVFQVSCES
jgi:hypothetical protein